MKGKDRNVTVINHGFVSGDTTAGGIERVDWMMGDKPDIVLVELGGDALRALDPASTERNLDAIVTKLKRQASRCGWPACWRRAISGPNTQRSSTVYLFRKIADKHDVPLYPFFLDGVAQDPALQQPMASSNARVSTSWWNAFCLS